MNAQAILLVWIVLSVAGGTLSAYGIVDGWADVRALGNRSNGRRTLARSFLITEALRFSVQLVWFLVGAAAWLDLAAQPQPVHVTLGVLAVFWGNIALAVKSMILLYARSAVRNSAATHESA